MSWLASKVHMEHTVPGIDTGLDVVHMEAAQDRGEGKGFGIWRLK